MFYSRIKAKLGACLSAALVLLAVIPALAQGDIECDPSGATWCRVTATGLPLRLLVKPGARVFLEMDEASHTVDEDITPFSVLFAFEEIDVSYDANNFTATGWYRVGTDASGPEGFVKAGDVVPWKLALALAYTNPGPSERRPVLMFENNEALLSVLDEIQSGSLTADGLFEEVDKAVNEKTPAPPGIVSREGNGWVDIAQTFYLLPILQYENLDAIQPDLLGLQIAALTNQGASQQSTACDLRGSAAGACLQAQTGGAIDSLALDVVFAIDTTNSMQPHIDAVTGAITEAAQTLSQKLPDAEALKFGLVGYRDEVESNPALEYLTQNFTPDLLPVSEFQTLLESGAVTSSSSGSGDWEEEVFAGVRDAIKSNWSPNSARMVVLIGDASSHRVGEPKNTSGLSEAAIKELAAQENVYIASIYVAGNNSADLALARPQFEAMAAGDAESGSVAFSIVQSDTSSAAGLDGGATGLQDSLREALGKIGDFLGTGQFDSIQQAGTSGADTTGQAVLGAVRGAFVDYVGQGATPPSNITAWVIDRDLADLVKRSFDVKLMLDRGEVQELSAALDAILGKFREGQSTSSSFLQQVQIGSTATSYDLKISDTEALSDSPLVPQWIKNLPYKSNVLTLSVEEFRSSSADDRAGFEQRLEKLVALYEELMSRPEDWVQLNAEGSAEDAVYMLGLNDLP